MSSELATHDPFERICAILERGRDRRYGVESVSQYEHALQCGALAARESDSNALIVAALLHDIGHLINPDDVDAFIRGEDAEHEKLGADFLTQWFGDEVVAAVRLHVDAKRYLAAWEPDYVKLLSKLSKRTLELQGGPFNSQEAASFLLSPGAEQALMVRRWDERAKAPGVETPPLEDFRGPIQAMLRVSAA